MEKQTTRYMDCVSSFVSGSQQGVLKKLDLGYRKKLDRRKINERQRATSEKNACITPLLSIQQESRYIYIYLVFSTAAAAAFVVVVHTNNVQCMPASFTQQTTVATTLSTKSSISYYTSKCIYILLTFPCCECGVHSLVNKQYVSQRMMMMMMMMEIHTQIFLLQRIDLVPYRI